MAWRLNPEACVYLCSMQDLLYRYIAIEGNIGAGKTTLCTRLANDWQARLILEQFTDNPFLPPFYQHPERYAFPVELFFMTERHKQLQEELSQGDLFSDLVIADYFFLKTLLFAHSNLNDEEFRLFQRLFQVLNASFRSPEIMLYIHRPIQVLKKHIAMRGRSYEQQIPDEYLLKVQQAYFDFFKTQPDFPVLVLHAGETDFTGGAGYYKQIQNLLMKPWEAGIHHLEMDSHT